MTSTTHPHRRQRGRVVRSLSGLAAATLTATLAVVGLSAGQALAATPTVVSQAASTRLVQSTGNLYWTSNAINEFGPDFAGIYRTGKTSTPGQEILLYSESTDAVGYFFFGDLTYALVSGTYYGYFTANYVDEGITQIKRIALTGGTSTILGTSPALVGTRDLLTDGSFLYWTDAAGLRKMSVNGGAITTLATGTNFSKIGLDATQVYFSAGTALDSVPKAGGAVTQRFTTASAIQALYVQPATASGTVIFWGEANDSVNSRPVGGAVSTYQAATSGRQAISVSFDGTRVLWTDANLVGNGYGVRSWQSGVTTVASSGEVGSNDVQGDATAMFWGNVSGIRRFNH